MAKKTFCSVRTIGIGGLIFYIAAFVFIFYVFSDCNQCTGKLKSDCCCTAVGKSNNKCCRDNKVKRLF